MMNINQLKSYVGIQPDAKMNFVRNQMSDGTESDYFTWFSEDDTKRISVHKSVISDIKEADNIVLRLRSKDDIRSSFVLFLAPKPIEEIAL